MNINKFANYKVIFWDFDGTIKESNSIKTDAFEQLFQDFGDVLVKKIRQHHIENEGVSRYIKIPKYMKWAGITTTEFSLSYYCDMFSELVVNKVVGCPWVEGVEEFLLSNPYNQKFILITATPQDEINRILSGMNCSNIFDTICGYPMNKHKVVSDYIHCTNTPCENILVVGDSYSDLLAAKKSNVEFCLRITKNNKRVQMQHHGIRFKSLKL